MTVQELNTPPARLGHRDAKHRQRVELYEHQLTIRSRPAPVYPCGPTCGDCEHIPCVCEPPNDLDLAWLPRLADHDLVQRPSEKS